MPWRCRFEDEERVIARFDKYLDPEQGEAAGDAAH